MHTLRLKLLETLPPRLDIPVVRVVNHHLSTLYREEVQDLVLKLGLDPSTQFDRLFRSGRDYGEASITVGWPTRVYPGGREGLPSAWK